jgi:2-keto-3-deoxy-L-arabinonate dehydratase
MRRARSCVVCDASEGYSLAEDERRRLLEVIVEGERRSSAAHRELWPYRHGCRDRAESRSRDYGANMRMALPPYFIKPDAEGIYYDFREISNAVSIPIMVEDAPDNAGLNGRRPADAYGAARSITSNS